MSDDLGAFMASIRRLSEQIEENTQELRRLTAEFSALRANAPTVQHPAVETAKAASNIVDAIFGGGKRRRR